MAKTHSLAGCMRKSGSPCSPTAVSPLFGEGGPEREEGWRTGFPTELGCGTPASPKKVPLLQGQVMATTEFLSSHMKPVKSVSIPGSQKGPHDYHTPMQRAVSLLVAQGCAHLCLGVKGENIPPTGPPPAPTSAVSSTPHSPENFRLLCTSQLSCVPWGEPDG